MLKRREYIKKIIPFIDKDVIKVLTGIRRSGKSVMLKLIMEELKNRKIDEKQFIYINFENLKNRNLRNCEKLYDFNFDIYITGSNAKLLSGELSTYLAGRYVEFVIYPFSFKEFFEIIKVKNSNISAKEAFQDYVKFGGMPFFHNLDYKNYKIIKLKKTI